MILHPRLDVNIKQHSSKIFNNTSIGEKMTFKNTIKAIAISAGLLALIGCGSTDSSSNAKEESTNAKLFAYGVSSDYKSGELRFGDLDSLELGSDTLGFGGDAKLFSNGKYVYILAPSNITVINASEASKGESAILAQVSIGDYAYPASISFNSDSTAWLIENGTTNAVKIDAITLDAIDTISLAKYAQEGSLSANAVASVITGDTLAILIGRLDNYNATEVGLVALFNTNSGKLLDTIPLNTLNPTAMGTYKGKLIVATQGTYNASYSCDADSLRALESVDLSKKKSTVLATGKDFGGGLYKLAIDSESGVAYVSVYASYGSVPLAAYDFTTNKVTNLSKVGDAEGALYFDSESELLFVGDRSYGSEALYAYDGTNFTKIKVSSDVLPSYSATVARW